MLIPQAVKFAPSLTIVIYCPGGGWPQFTCPLSSKRWRSSLDNKVTVRHEGDILVNPGSNPSPLWLHQDDAIKDMTKKIRLNNGQPFAGLLVIPTGGGKTVVAVRWLLQNIIYRNKKVLWIAHRHELLEQAFLAVKDNAYTEGMLPPDGLDIPPKRFHFRIISGQHGKPVDVQREDNIIIASKDSLNKGLSFLEKKWLDSDNEVFLVIDEAHHAPAKTYRKIIDALKDGNRVFRMLGLTATPFRTIESEQGLLGKLFPDNIVYKIDLRTLINRGILATPDLDDLKTNVNVSRDLTARDIKTIQAFDELPEHVATQIAGSNERNAMIVRKYVQNYDKYGPLLVFAVNVNHAIALNELFNVELNRLRNTQGEKYSEYVVGDIRDKATGVRIASEQNKRKIDAFREGTINVLVNVMILTEGIDLPNAQTVFLTRPTMSTILMTQMIGRVLRGKNAGGSDKAYIVSFVDDWADKINWVSPERVLIEGEFDDDDREFRKKVLKLISIAKIEEFARMMNEQIDALEAPDFIQRIPIGIYSFSVLMPPKNGDALEKNCEALVFDHVLSAYQDFINDLPEVFKTANVTEQEYLDAEELDKLLATVVDEYFESHDFLCSQRDEDIKDILRYYAQTGETPSFLEFKDRDKCDLTQVAKHIYDNLTFKQRPEYEDSIWKDTTSFWQVLFGHRRDYFRRQLSIELEKLSDPESGKKVSNQVQVRFSQVECADLPLGKIKEQNWTYWRELHDGVYSKHTDAAGVITCSRCGFRSKHKIRFQVDHILPMAKGGKSVPENLQILCRPCNAVKSDTVEGQQAICDKCGAQILNPTKVDMADGSCRLIGTCDKCGTRMARSVAKCSETVVESPREILEKTATSAGVETSEFNWQKWIKERGR